MKNQLNEDYERRKNTNLESLYDKQILNDV